ncbi:hypothetical protein RM550_24765 [Streptomyces sp. DSM 41527]|uniref:Uncharacterized protein n=1 Tax=Streptomyces mooreae TaxID=3075523 RepID=A0ABU2TDA2_9ACTN|nr:hypothetical protein [Streptomyces sp. DSM 41527]MDT0458895.1 hypothetical protein [Streptomyces sp. DSM 41527]
MSCVAPGLWLTLLSPPQWKIDGDPDAAHATIALMPGSTSR